MAEITVTDPKTSIQSGMTVNGQTPATTAGSQGHGTHVDGAAMSEGVTRQIDAAQIAEGLTGLLHTPYDEAVTICGYPDLVMNQMLRSMGYRQVMSTEYDHFSVDQRRCIDSVDVPSGSSAPSLDLSTITASGTTVFKGTKSGSATTRVVNVPVANVGIFHESDQIIFKGVSGYDSDGLTHYGYYLNGYVSKVYRSGASANTIDVILLNANPASSLSVTSISIPDDTKIIILGHALCEEDSQTVSATSIPSPSRQFMQKFMTQANVTNVWLESDRTANWGLKDIKESVNREFMLEIEKTYWFGTKQYFLDPETQKFVRTTAGFLQQMMEEGVGYLEMWKGELTDESLISDMAQIFVGNRGSEHRYMLTGMNFAAAMFSLKSMQQQVGVNKTRREFTYDWNEWSLFNFTISNKPYSLFDMLGMSNMAVVFDKANIKRCVFRAMDEDMLDLDKLAIADMKVLRCSEISSIVIEQPKSHRFIVMHAGQHTDPTKADYNASANGFPLDPDFAEQYME